MSTTTTSYVDLTDTQMLDYAADADFTMDGSGSSPGWLTLEATMSDDTTRGTEAVLEDYPESIEVDMEPHGEDEEMHEYEMAGEEMDGMQHHGAADDAELVDIEVIDPSRAPSPDPTNILAPHSAVESLVGESLISPASVQQFSPSVATTETGHESTDATLAAGHTVADVGLVPDFQHVQAQSPLAFSAVVLSDAPPTVEASHIEAAEVAVPAEVFAISHLPEEAEAARDDPASATSDLYANGDDTARAGAEPPATYEDTVAQYEENSATGEVADGAHEEAAAAYEETVPVHAEAAYTEQGEHEADYEEPTADTDYGHTTEVDYERHTSHGEDPHEISDGVYIDPPPAVLLTLVTPEGSSECSLFNQPLAPIGSQNTNGYASTSTTGELTLLLHQRPTLYYEPLNQVFDALRQEESVSNVPEFADGELVLDAYDLDLRITEDNVFAREVTIHDLNVLHDEGDLRGPLRLRLSVSSPRFIIRYRALRDQISQLTLGLEDDVGADVGADAEDSNFQTHALPDDSGEYIITASPEQSDLIPGQYEAYEDADATETTAGPAYGEAEENAEEYAGTEEAVDLTHEYPADEDAQPAPDNVPASEEVHEHEAADHQDQYGESTDVVDQAEGLQEEYGVEVPAEEAAEGLDADEVHPNADAEDGGDYTAFAENVEEDDERYGEALPDELGGSAEANVYEDDASENPASALFPEEQPIHEAVDEGEPEAAHEQNSNLQEEPARDDEGDGGHTEDAVQDNVSLAPEANDHETITDWADTEELQDYVETDDFDAVDLPQHDLGDEQDAEWDEYEDGDDNDNLALSKDAYENDDALSKYSSETLSSTRSKRSRDEEDEENATAYGSPPLSPDSKRARVQ